MVSGTRLLDSGFRGVQNVLHASMIVMSATITVFVIAAVVLYYCTYKCAAAAAQIGAATLITDISFPLQRYVISKVMCCSRVEEPRRPLSHLSSLSVIICSILHRLLLIEAVEFTH